MKHKCCKKDTQIQEFINKLTFIGHFLYIVTNKQTISINSSTTITITSIVLISFVLYTYTKYKCLIYCNLRLLKNFSTLHA